MKSVNSYDRALFALLAALLSAVPLLLRADTYVYLGGAFNDPHSWSDIDTGGNNVPKAGDTAQFSDGTVAAPTGETFGVVACGGSLTLTGGSLTAGQVAARLFLQSSALTVQNAGGLNLAQVFVPPGSQLTALANTAGNVQVQGGIFQAQGDYGPYGNPNILNVSGGGGVAVAGNASLNLQDQGVVDGAGSTLAVNGALSLDNGGFVVQNGGSVTSGSGIVGSDIAAAGAFNNGVNVLLSGKGSHWTVNGSLQVGLFAAAPGPLVPIYVQNGAALTAQALDLGVGRQGAGQVTAGFTPPQAGPTSGGTILVTGPIRVGVAANGSSLDINSGSHFEMSSASPLELGVLAGSDGRVFVTGPDTVANFGSAPINVGVAGHGVFTLSGTNSFTSGPVQVAVEATSGRGTQGASFLGGNDPGTSWSVNGPLTVGVAGNGSVLLTEGARLVSSGESTLGQETGSVGLADVWGLAPDGTSTVLTEWLANGGLTVGESGNATLDLESGGSVELPARPSLRSAHRSPPPAWCW